MEYVSSTTIHRCKNEHEGPSKICCHVQPGYLLKWSQKTPQAHTMRLTYSMRALALRWALRDRCYFAFALWRGLRKAWRCQKLLGRFDPKTFRCSSCTLESHQQILMRGEASTFKLTVCLILESNKLKLPFRMKSVGELACKQINLQRIVGTLSSSGYPKGPNVETALKISIIFVIISRRRDLLRATEGSISIQRLTPSCARMNKRSANPNFLFLSYRAYILQLTSVQIKGTHTSNIPQGNHAVRQGRQSRPTTNRN